MPPRNKTRAPKDNDSNGVLHQLHSQERNSLHDESDDSDDGSTPSSQSKSLTATEEGTLAGQVCNLLLAGEVKKIPVKRAFIRKHILKNHRKQLDSVMSRAREMMKHVFGYKIVTLKDSYIVVNTLKSDLVKSDCTKEEAYLEGLLSVILMAVFLSEGKISAVALEATLKALDVQVNTLKPCIQEFTRRKYLEVVAETTSDPPTVMYKWGERAHAEYCKTEMLELICKIYENMNPTQWKYQWGVIQEEKKREP